MNLHSMSDNELEQIASGKMPAKKSAGSLEDLSDHELEQLAGIKPLENPSLLEKIGSSIASGIHTAGKFVDSYTGAPTRAAVGAIEEGKNPISAFSNQFGSDSSLAPTGKQLALRAGVSDEPMFHKDAGELLNQAAPYAQGIPTFGPLFSQMMKSKAPQMQGVDISPSPADAVGVAGDIGLDYTNILPLGAIAKGGAKIFGKGAQIAGRVASSIPKVESTAKILADSARATKQALDGVFSPKRAVDFEHWAQVAKNNGIDPSILPESIEFGPGSVISRGARTVREGPIGDIEMRKFEDGMLQVDGAIDNKVAQIAGGPPLNDVEAGQVIREGYDKAVDDLFNNVDFTYNGVINQSPGIALTPKSLQNINRKLSEIQKFAETEYVHGVAKEVRNQAGHLLEDLQAIRGRMSAKDPVSKSFGSMKQAYEVMSQVGRQAFKKGARIGEIPVDQKKFQELYFTMRDEFINSTHAQLGEDIANQLIDSNQQITMFNKSKEPIAKLLANKDLAPEKLFRSLIVTGDTTKLAALKDMLTPEQFNALKGSYVERLITRNSNGTINFGALRTALSKNRTTLSVLFEPQEIVDLVDLAHLGEKWGPAVLSTSGTGGSNLFRNMLEGAQSGILNKTVIDTMKDSARAKSAVPEALRAIPGSISQKSKGVMRRSGPEEGAKYAQMLAAIETNKKNNEDSATKRRMEQLLKERMNK